MVDSNNLIRAVVSETLKNKLKEIAKICGRSLSAECNIRLIKSLDDHPVISCISRNNSSEVSEFFRKK